MRSIALRMVVVLVLLGLGVSQLDLGAVGESLRGLDPVLAAAGTITLLAGQLVGALRWRSLVARLGGQAAPAWFTGEYLRACFVSSVLPTAYGGDVVRVTSARRLVGHRRAALSVMLDRLAGFGALAFAAGLLLPLAGYELPGDGVAALAALAVVALVGTCAVLVRRRAAGVAGWSLAYLILWLAGVWLLAGSLQVSFPLAALPAVMLVVGAAMALPISIGATGTREAGFVVSLVPLGVGAPQAVALGVTFGLAVTLVALCGAPAALRSARPPENPA